MLLTMLTMLTMLAMLTMLTMLTSAKPPREMSATSGAGREVMLRHKTGDFAFQEQ